jgi:hypothetical protein
LDKTAQCASLITPYTRLKPVLGRRGSGRKKGIEAAE